MMKIFFSSLRFICILFCIITPAIWIYAQTPHPSTPDIKTIDLTSTPLYAQGSGEKPTLTLALSVEYPTVGAQYKDIFTEGTEYLGYFDSKSCYSYTKSIDTEQRYFYKISETSENFECNGLGFSGNLMNWASSSSIDLLRLGLTGGDRIIDTHDSTVLQRAVLQNNFFNSSSDFPRKILPQSIALKYLPEQMVGRNNGEATGDVQISNCLNRIYFFPQGITFTSSGASACSDTPNISNTFTPAQGTPQSPITTSRPTGFDSCATADSGTCDVNEPSEVIFGTDSRWISFYTDRPISCNYQILGDPEPGTQKYCWKKSVESSLIKKTIKDIAGNGDSFYYSKIKVCDILENRLNYCQRYPNGNMKPVGNLQKYSDRLRVAAFGYLMQSGTAQYGGVLRAPMKFVGPKKYTGAQSSDNENAEWDSNTGIFYNNPHSAPEGNSGVINYLNKFGRTRAFGVYKSNDPLGELYYESLRYLQGLPPTPEAVNNLTTSNKDNFAVYSSWTDPFANSSSSQDYACLRNSILTIADKNTHADKSLPGNDRTSNNDFSRSSNVSKNIPNFKEWTKVVSGFESNRDISYKDSTGMTRNTTTPTGLNRSNLNNLETVDTGAGQAAYYIAGAAYWANTHDIRGTDWTEEPTKQRPGMRIKTYVLDVNEGRASNTDSTRWNSQLFLAAKYGGFNDPDNDGNPYTPSITNDNLSSQHWAKDSAPREAKTYFLASDAKAVLRALDEIFASATQVSSSIAKPALSNNKISTDGSYYYQSDFDPEYWSGDVRRRTITLNSDGTLNVSQENNALSAAKVMDSLTNTSLSNRKILIGKHTPSDNSYATYFKWENLDSTAKSHLNKETPTATPDNRGKDRLNFIRGDRSLEAIEFRKRGSRLGDIINSGIAYSGVPATGYTDSAYKTFFSENKGRTPTIFVGANDGMLHAFNANTLEEVFAYIPSWLTPKLSQLTAIDYNSSRHTSFVDATPTVGEAKLGDMWKTVLVSGTGNGGQGVFALDVTSPNTFDASNVLWEFTDTDDVSLGNVVGKISILKFATDEEKGVKKYKWFAVVPSGVNNYINEGNNRFSTTGEPALFLLDLDKPKNSSWTLGTNYFKIVFPLNSDATIETSETKKASGIINFNATGNYDGSVEYIYIGDLHGQLWKLDMKAANLSSTSPSNWSLEKVSYFKSGNTPKPMYIAKDASHKTQPISMVPTIAYGPYGSYIVAFGTGKYLEASDNNINTNTQIHSFYVLFDDNKTTSIDTGRNASINGRTRLQQATINIKAGTITTSPFTWKTATELSGIAKSGWFIDLPKSGINGGEKQITEAVLFGKEIIFNSTLPPSASSSACGGGASHTYTADLANGIGTVSNLNQGAMGSPMLLHLKTIYGATGATGDRIKTEKVGLLNPSAHGLGDESAIKEKNADFPVGRLSWRQIHNYHELKNKTWP